ncbi:HD-GYP domain-containing protein [Loktanella sp. M215]|uniref:HD-GYP domain-containing protein n=1 Tax=Loktanella sp. M215 TaxID=2675431 RepID=UPI001F3FA55B|nr:HD domain-containing protein [Loktanella sp. M215]
MTMHILPHTSGHASALRLADILGPLSHALDLTEGQAPGHCIRCCHIGTRIGEMMGLNDAEMDDLYYTLLLKDLGCSSNAARICELYLADDLSFKRDFKSIDGSLSAALRFVFAKTGLESGLTERIGAIINILRNGGEIVDDLIETRCHRGADIAARMRFSTAVQDGVRCLDEHWDGGGRPAGLAGEAIPLNARIALLSQVVDIFHSSGGRAAALLEVQRRAGSWFDPDLVSTFTRLAADPGFWADLTSPFLQSLVLSQPSGHRLAVVDAGYLDDIAQAFADVIDAKSNFTADHSRRVTFYADIIAEQMGHDPAGRRWLRRGALLHDLGKLGISNQILDKAGKLDSSEWTAIRQHPDTGADILSNIAVFGDIAPLARDHHERLDGKGYPSGCDGDSLPLSTRIVTVADVFDALSAKRPYRAAMPIAEVFTILDRDRSTAFDPDCIDALRSGLDRMARTAN